MVDGRDITRPSHGMKQSKMGGRFIFRNEFQYPKFSTRERHFGAVKGRRKGSFESEKVESGPLRYPEQTATTTTATIKTGSATTITTTTTTTTTIEISRPSKLGKVMQ